MTLLLLQNQTTDATSSAQVSSNIPSSVLPLSLFILALVLLVFYFWKKRLTDKAKLDAPRMKEAPVAPQASDHITAASKPKEVAAPSEIEEILADTNQSWLTRLKIGLEKSRNQLTGHLSSLFASKPPLNEELLESLHELIYRSDMGVEIADYLINYIKQSMPDSKSADWESVSPLLREGMVKLFPDEYPPLAQPTDGPLVILVVGVNGVGKTTSIGKLAARFIAEGKSVTLCAADTYRAAAIEQLQVWGKRLNVPVISQTQGSDPASVAFDAVKSVKTLLNHVLLIDTAGRLHNKQELMDELSKVKRVIGKELPQAPHETWLVIDSTNGQNAIQQVQAFQTLIQLSGLIVTKLDGTAKGGVILAIQRKFQLPIRYIGIGEKAADLRPFIAKDFINSLI